MQSILTLIKVKEKWNEYKKFLMEKYPVAEDEEWEFTCSYHKEIDDILDEEYKDE